MILDSNIIIYAALPQHAYLLQFIADTDPCVSQISRLEVLGYHGLTMQDRLFFENFFDEAEVISISDEIITRAIQLRQQRNISIGDSVLAATALIYGFTLVTRNEADFRWITDLKVVNPIRF